uniref:Uncharacterized protein n=1 Tax=Parascaris univalens TaxID=6257 RepID=A0A915C569_PARUN
IRPSPSSSEGHPANSCDLLNRHQLSRSQDRELQRYIDANSHLLQYIEKPFENFKARKPPSNYTNIRNTLGGSAHRVWTPPGQQQRRSRSAGYNTGPPYLDNWTTDQSVHRPYWESTSRSRKEVTWSDTVPAVKQRARSLSPFRTDRARTQMLHYGSTDNLNDRWNDNHGVRDRTASPAYSSLDRHRDDYNRYETARHTHAKKLERVRREEEERSRFSGYGDRPGSGVELMPTKWQGGEIVFDRRQLPKSLKPRRIYYSPIGDGVVAADGVEVKRAPKDMSPRISVTHTRTVEKGDPGRDGYNVYEKTITHSGGSEYGSEYGGTSGRNSRTPGTLSPSSENFGGACGMGPIYVGTPHGFDNIAYGGGARAPSYEVPPREYMGTKESLAQEYGSEPLGDVCPGATLNSGSGGSGGYGGGGGFASTYGGTGPEGYGSGSRGSKYASGGGRSYGTPTSTLGASSAPDIYGTARASDYTTPASHDPYSTLRSAPSDPFTADIRGRSRSHDMLNEGTDGYSGYGTVGDGRSSAAQGQYGLRVDSPRRTEITTDYLITNPRELIHQYATTTPVAVLDIVDNSAITTSRAVNRSYTSTYEEKFAPYPPYKGSNASVHPNNFVRQLRDENLTISQREANRHQEPLNIKDSSYEQKISEIRSRSSRGPTISEIDYLTEKMMHGLQTGHPTPPQL